MSTETSGRPGATSNAHAQGDGVHGMEAGLDQLPIQVDLVVVSNDALRFFRSGFDTGGDGNSGVVGDDDAETHGSGRA